MRWDAAPGHGISGSGGTAVPWYVVVVRTEAGRTFRSVPFGDRDTAEKVARFSWLDRDVIDARVEEASRRDGEDVGGLRPC
jgi:hypothetical protein